MTASIGLCPPSSPDALLGLLPPRGTGAVVRIPGPPPGHSGGPGWLKEAVRGAGSSLSRDGIVWLTPGRRLQPWIPAAAAGAGLEMKGVFAQFADSRGPKILAPLELLASGDVAALSGRHVRALRLAAGALRLPGALRLLQALYPGTGFVLGRPSGPPLFDWLFPGDRADGNRPVLLRRSWHRPDFVVAYIFDGEPARLTAVGKIATTPEAVSALAAQEEILRRLAPGAAGWGAETPRLARYQPVARPALITQAIRGDLAASILERKPSEFCSLMDKLSSWLTGWNDATMSAVSPDRAARDLEDAARTLEPQLPGGRQYFAWLGGKLTEQEAIPQVASHGDLTMWNVVLGVDGLGVLDWEEARAKDVPLGDLFYALADATAATTGYRDRVTSFHTCFFGSRRQETAAWIDGLAGHLGLSVRAVEICFHLCWLRHACNEVRREAPGTAGPFLQIVRQLASPGHHTPFG